MDNQLLSLLHLFSSSLPVGAYSYSEGLEALVELGIIYDKNSLENWIRQELSYGAIRVEAIVMLRMYEHYGENDFEAVNAWNHWLSATRETPELRQQSWQMGQSLLKLLIQLRPELAVLESRIDLPCNYVLALAIAVYSCQIDPKTAIKSYLYSWASNLVSAGVKLIPLGQTPGQQLLWSLHDLISEVSEELVLIPDEKMGGWSWGLSLGSMSHHTQYTRLFRS